MFKPKPNANYTKDDKKNKKQTGSKERNSMGLVAGQAQSQGVRWRRLPWALGPIKSITLHLLKADKRKTTKKRLFT